MRILLPIDGSASSRRAVDYVATRTGLSRDSLQVFLLHVTHTVTPRSFLAPEETERFYREQAEEFFAPARQALADAGIKPHEMVVPGEPATAIAETAQKCNADLTVMGSRGMSPVSALLIGSVAQGVIAQSKRPVLLIRGENLPPDDDVRVGLAVDGSEFSRTAAEYIAAHRQVLGKSFRLFAIHVEKHPQAEETSGTAPDKGFEAAMDTVRPVLREAGIEAEEISLQGNPAEQLQLCAEDKKLDILVMGSHGYGRIRSAIMGSVTEELASRGTIPLLITRSGK